MALDLTDSEEDDDEEEEEKEEEADMDSDLEGKKEDGNYTAQCQPTIAVFVPTPLLTCFFFPYMCILLN